ncbi:MAG: N-acetylmuramoyl-L-alanine amidase [Vicingaceae bacterium]
MMYKRNTFIVVIIMAISMLSFLYPVKDGDFFGVKKVVIDAGHGGHDGGCQGAFSNEKDVALAISLKLGKYIEENFEDVEVIYTRKTDVFIPLYERAKIANKANADLFICIHANAGSKTAYGCETYVMGLHKTESNLKVAQRENASILLEEDYETKYSDFDPNSPESYIAIALRQNAFLDQSLSLAAKIQKQFKERVGRHDRGVKQAGFLVLHQTAMPSVLIETGFLTNPEEEKFLNSEIGQDYMASAVYRAFKEYKKELEVKLNSGVTEEKTNDTAPINSNTVEEEEGKSNHKKNKTKEKEKNKTTVDNSGIVFKVQIATSANKLDLLPQNFKGLEPIEVYEAGGLYRYTYGITDDVDKAYELQKQARAVGYNDAFVIAFNNGKRITVSEAIKLKK